MKLSKKKYKFTTKRLFRSLKPYHFKKASIQEVENGKTIQFYISKNTGLLLQLITKENKIVDGRLYGEVKHSDLFHLKPKVRNQIIYHNFHLQFCGKLEEKQIVFKVTPQLASYLKILETTFHTTYEPHWSTLNKFNHNSLPLMNPCLEEDDSILTEKIKDTLKKLNYQVKDNIDLSLLESYKYLTPIHPNKIMDETERIEYRNIEYKLERDMTRKERKLYQQQVKIIKKLEYIQKTNSEKDYHEFLYKITNLLDYYGISGVLHPLSFLAQKNQVKKKKMWEILEEEMELLNEKSKRRETVDWAEFYKKRKMEYNIFRYPNKEFKYLIEVYGLFGQKKKEVSTMSASEVNAYDIAKRNFACIVSGNEYRIETEKNKIPKYRLWKKSLKSEWQHAPIFHVKKWNVEQKNETFLEEQLEIKNDIEKLKCEMTETEYQEFLVKYDFLLRYYDLKPQILSEEYIQQKLNITPEDEEEYHQKFEEELVREKVQIKYEKERITYQRAKNLLSEIELLLSGEQKLPNFVPVEMEAQFCKTKKGL